MKNCVLVHLVGQSCLTLCDPLDCRPPGSSVHGISQARILEWVAVSFSRDSSQPWIESASLALAGRFFTLSLLGSHTKNCGVSILSSLCHSDHISAPYLFFFPLFFSIFSSIGKHYWRKSNLSHISSLWKVWRSLFF